MEREPNRRADISQPYVFVGQVHLLKILNGSNAGSVREGGAPAEICFYLRPCLRMSSGMTLRTCLRHIATPLLCHHATHLLLHHVTPCLRGVCVSRETFYACWAGFGNKSFGSIASADAGMRCVLTAGGKHSIVRIERRGGSSAGGIYEKNRTGGRNGA